MRRQQIRDGLRSIVLQLALFGKRERLQVARDLMKVRSNDDEAFALRTLLEFEQAQYGFAIGRVATQAVARFGGIGDETAAFEVGGEATRGND